MNYLHMNANPLDLTKFERILNDENYIAQEKFKGIRCFIRITNSGSSLHTRGGKDCSRNFPHLTTLDTLQLNWGVSSYVLDGELFQRGIEDEVIAGLANRKYGDPLETSFVEFHAFDVVEYEGVSVTHQPYSVRLRLLSNLEFGDSAIKHVPRFIGSAEDKLLFYEEIIQNGGEGIMLKNLTSTYKEGKRPQHHWYKIKSSETYDVVIMGSLPGKGKFEGMIGSLSYGMYNEKGTLCYLGNFSGFTDDERQYITNHIEDYLLNVVEVKAAGQDKSSGALIEPRFIRTRIDKRPEECVWQR